MAIEDRLAILEQIILDACPIICEYAENQAEGINDSDGDPNAEKYWRADLNKAESLLERISGAGLYHGWRDVKL